MKTMYNYDILPQSIGYSQFIVMMALFIKTCTGKTLTEFSYALNIFQVIKLNPTIVYQK
jgi:hypothetical protein